MNSDKPTLKPKIAKELVYPIAQTEKRKSTKCQQYI